MTQDVSEKPFFVTLPNRGLIRITGADRCGFLDALVSNDLTLLDRQPSVYACLLTPQGKFLYDFIVWQDGETLILDCEGGDRLAGLEKKLKLYKLRSKIGLESIDNVPVYALPPPHPNPLPSGEKALNDACPSSPSPQRGEGRSEGAVCPDPRHPSLGHRTLTKPANMEERPFAAWDAHRISLCVPDGSRDMVPEQSTLVECNIDALNGISFEKGCYIGQELTARMHHRGLAKKHLYTLDWHDTPPAFGEDIHINGTLIGQMRSSCGTIGLALLKDEAIKTLAGAPALPFALLNASRMA